jgi:hypothetical protein
LLFDIALLTGGFDTPFATSAQGYSTTDVSSLFSSHLFRIVHPVPKWTLSIRTICARAGCSTMQGMNTANVNLDRKMVFPFYIFLTLLMGYGHSR